MPQAIALAWLSKITAFAAMCLLIMALWYHRRSPSPLSQTIVWLGLAMTIGSAKSILTQSGGILWGVLWGGELLAIGSAAWQLRLHWRGRAT
jgi:hypothetical protein